LSKKNTKRAYGIEKNWRKILLKRQEEQGRAQGKKEQEDNGDQEGEGQEYDRGENGDQEEDREGEDDQENSDQEGHEQEEDRESKDDSEVDQEDHDQEEDRDDEGEDDQGSENEQENRMAFKYEVALRLPALDDTSNVAVRDFLNCVEAYNDVLDPAAEKSKLIKFVVKTKITGVAKTRLGNATTDTFSE